MTIYSPPLFLFLIGFIATCIVGINVEDNLRRDVE
jgi:hypothetical protein